MGSNEHMEGTVLIFGIELLFLEEHSDIPIEYEFTLTGLTSGELLLHSLCMHVQNFIDSLEKFYCNTRSMAQLSSCL